MSRSKISKQKTKEHMVYIEGENIIVQGKTERLSFNLSAAKSLVQDLIQATHVLTELRSTKENRIEEVRKRLFPIRKDLNRKDFFDVIASWNEGYLCHADDAILANMFTVDAEGWAYAEKSLSRHGVAGLLLLLALREENDVLSELWGWGSFDFLLREAVWDVPPEQVPHALHMRLMPFLCQECYIEAGNFVMGFNGIDALPCETPMRTVERSRNIYMMRFPVTQLQYWILTGKNPSQHQGALRPVDSVSWWDAVELCNLYSDIMGYTRAYRVEDDKIHWDLAADGYRLPTEAEWECAAKAWKNDSFAGSNDPMNCAWFAENSNDKTHMVGSKNPNAAYLYDMSGNVWEWVFDAYSEFAYGMTDTIDPIVWEGMYRVCRGGGYTSSAESLRNTIRGAYEPTVKSAALGFRMVRTVSQ